MLLTLSLAGARLVRAANELAVVLLIDASDSIEPVQAKQAEEFVRGVVESIGPDEQAALVVFGANALVERPMSALADLAPMTTVPLSLNTDLAEAIRLGLALFPSGSARRLVLLSDGAATLGDTLAAADLAAASDVVIDVVPLNQAVLENEVYLRDVRAPTRVREGESFSVEVAVESMAATSAELQVLAGGSLIHREPVELRPGANNFMLRLGTTEQQFARYMIQVVPSVDEFYQNNSLALFTRIDGPPQVLMVSGQEASADDLDQSESAATDTWRQLLLALHATGLEVERVAPAEMPADLETLSNYDSIILVDVNAKSLTSRKMDSLKSYVRDLGGGLVTVGGPESYGMGGYYRTPLEDMLPVQMQIKDQERFPAIDMALVIDRSGSMSAVEGSLTKIQLAAEGAVRTVELLNDFDEIAILPVDTAVDGAIGPNPASDREQIISQIRQLGAGGGGIYVRTGLEAAASALAQGQNQIKHIILLADGADSEQKEGVPELIAALANEGVTVSTVSIGDGPDVSWLQQMAELGGGRFHFTDQAANLPQIFTQETTAIQRSYLIEETFFPELAQSPFAERHPVFRAMESAGITRVPPLYGYVGTSPKQTAQILLHTHLGDPLLATWEYGLGRAVAWTSDATGRWATDWVNWRGFSTFWSNLVRWSISEQADSNLEVEVEFSAEEAKLIVNARDGDGRLFDDLNLEAVIVDPVGQTSAHSLSQLAPGRYETAFLPQREGAYLIRVAGHTDDESNTVGQTDGWVLGYSPEYIRLEGDPSVLVAIAERTGGRDLSEQFANREFEAVLAHDLPAGVASRPIWPWLLTVAIFLWPIDIALRRIVITLGDAQNWWQHAFGRSQRAATTDDARSGRVARLRRAKERATQHRQDMSQSTPLPDAGLTDSRADTLGDLPDSKMALPPDRILDGEEFDIGDEYDSLASRLLERRQKGAKGSAKKG